METLTLRDPRSVEVSGALWSPAFDPKAAPEGRRNSAVGRERGKRQIGQGFSATLQVSFIGVLVLAGEVSGTPGAPVGGRAANSTKGAETCT